MGKLLSFMKEFDIASALPDIRAFLLDLEKILRIIVMAGPLTVLGLGLWYYLAPPKEANHAVGFRTYWGMGSIAAWRYTQRMAGTFYSILGLSLTVIMSLICNGFRGMDPMKMAVTALVCVIIEMVLILGAWAAVHFLAYKKFDKDGKIRKEQ